MAEFARDLDTLRRACGLSYRDLARRTGCPRSTLNDALRGRRFPRLSTVRAIARACAADEDYWHARWAAVDQAARAARAAGTRGTDEAIEQLLSVLDGRGVVVVLVVPPATGTVGTRASGTRASGTRASGTRASGAGAGLGLGA